jgi:hypothetical protein
MLPASWKPVPASGLIRLGAQEDGGYVLSARAVAASGLLLSMGLNDDWRFEQAFREMTGARIICFDHSVTGRFWARYTLSGLVQLRLGQAVRYLAYRRFFARQGIEHRRLKIGYDAPGGVSLATLLREAKEDSIFLKIDIEGSEYRILGDIVANARRFTAIVMEFHDVDLHRGRIASFLESLRGFTIVALHANNIGGADPAGDPIVMEISLIRDDLVDPADGPGRDPGPALLPNDPSLPDIELNFAAPEV